MFPAEVWSWTGFYIGGHVGAGWGTTESTLTNFSVVPPGIAFPLNVPFSQNSRSGFLGGGQVGANWQTGWAVFGVQGDIAGLDVKGTTPCWSCSGLHHQEQLAGDGDRPSRRGRCGPRPGLRQGRRAPG